MITYYMFGYFCGYFRTVDTTETPEKFAAYLKKYKFTRDGSKIIDSEGKQHGTITSDTTGGESNSDPVVGGHIHIKQSE